MILSELKRYLTAHKRASIGDLANRFAAEPDAVRGMLAHFIAKGRVRRLDDADANGQCGGCKKCDAYTMEIYEWTGA